jgi:hypothetical protein
VILIIAGAIIRSNIATSLDSFTFDEAYHIGAGAAYVQTGDFRLNPEQPPLTKLWTGTYVTLLGYQLSPYRGFSDKSDERDFVEVDAYQHNNPFVLQARARAAMFALNGLLLFLLAIAARRAFGDVVAIAIALYLAIDPTVAAHMPVVMTDLPVALGSGIGILASARAFTTWKPTDIGFAALGVALALTTKHSGVVTLGAVGLIGAAIAIVFANSANAATRLKRLGLVAVVLAGGMLVLWGAYGFRYNETPGTSEETFNRPLADKINDVKSPVYRAGLNAMNTTHLFPRAYIWGLADTIRAGLEGRAIPILAFGKQYYAKAPIYFFPGMIVAKLPIGLLLLSFVGLGFVMWRKIPKDFYIPLAIVTAFAFIYLFVLMRGSTYAGVRHALPLFPLVALLGSIGINYVFEKRSIAYGGVIAILLFVAIFSAVPQMRPWEYFNEMAGGAENGGRYFNDEGVDLSQRIGEIADYYHKNLESNGDVPFLAYFSNPADRRARGMDWVGRDPARDAHRYDSETISGTFIIGANELGPKPFWDVGKPFRGLQPVARFGNIFVFQGTFPRPDGGVSRALYNRALYTKLYVSEPDIQAGIDLLERSVAMDPTGFCASLELGNQYLKRGDRENALRAYRISYENAPRTDSIYDLLGDQILRIERDGLADVTPLRNPGIE